MSSDDGRHLLSLLSVGVPFIWLAGRLTISIVRPLIDWSSGASSVARASEIEPRPRTHPIFVLMFLMGSIFVAMDGDVSDFMEGMLLTMFGGAFVVLVGVSIGFVYALFAWWSKGRHLTQLIESEEREPRPMTLPIEAHPSGRTIELALPVSQQQAELTFERLPQHTSRRLDPSGVMAPLPRDPTFTTGDPAFDRMVVGWGDPLSCQVRLDAPLREAILAAPGLLRLEHDRVVIQFWLAVSRGQLKSAAIALEAIAHRLSEPPEPVASTLLLRVRTDPVPGVRARSLVLLLEAFGGSAEAADALAVALADPELLTSRVIAPHRDHRMGRLSPPSTVGGEVSWPEGSDRGGLAVVADR